VTDRAAAALARAAIAQVRPGDLVGLGSGRAASAFIHALGEAVRAGLAVTGVATSEASAALARSLGIALVDEWTAIDLAVDGADEVDPGLDLVKGYGAALVREKIVAAAARRFIILVGEEKLVPVLGARGRLPIEVVPFALPLCRRRLSEMDLAPSVRQAGQAPLVSDNGNLILDLAVSAISDPTGLEAALRAIPGVVGTGLFLAMADQVLVWDGERIRTLERNHREEGPS
jgi:ribose 5-phosphate isomerase A